MSHLVEDDDNKNMKIIWSSVMFLKQFYAFCCVELYKHLPQQLASRCDFLVSNPPYVTSQEMLRLDPEIFR